MLRVPPRLHRAWLTRWGSSLKNNAPSKRRQSPQLTPSGIRRLLWVNRRSRRLPNKSRVAKNCVTLTLKLAPYLKVSALAGMNTFRR